MEAKKKFAVIETEPSVMNLADAIAYQQGSVVSKQLIRKDTGTVTLFAFAKGEGLSEHTAPFDALVQVLEGDAEITISGKAYRVTTGQMITLPAGKPHSLHAEQNFKMLLVMIRS